MNRPFKLPSAHRPPNPYRDAVIAQSVVCVHCGSRHHPSYGTGCYAGPFSINDGPGYRRTATQRRRDDEAEREMTR